MILLAHNVEAYTAKCSEFYSGERWDPKVFVHYEFLVYNSVPRGEAPLTAAFGWGGEMNILEMQCIIDIERYCKRPTSTQKARRPFIRTDRR